MFNATLFAQSGQIKYIIKIPNTSEDQIHTIPGYLYFESNRSLFVYDTKRDRDMNSRVNRYRDDYGQMVYFDRNTNTCFFRVFFWMSPYISQESIPLLDWQLHSETKAILDKPCKKATTTFRGRKYTAWYTTLIPVNAGPWKLQGLPGTILEVQSEDGQIHFMAESVIFPCDIKDKIPDNIQEQLTIKGTVPGEYVTFDQFKEAREKEAKKSEEFLKNVFFPIAEQTAKERNIPLNSTKDWKIVSNNNMFAIEKFK
jgi:GLPGLI family protein